MSRPSWFDWLIGSRPPPVPVAPRPNEWAVGLCEVVNAERMRRGSPVLEVSGPLGDAAARWAGVMAAMGRLDHGDSATRIGELFPGRPSAENAAWGQTSPSQVVADWLQSPGHRRNLLGNYRLVGAGKSAGADGRMYWVCDFVR